MKIVDNFWSLAERFMQYLWRETGFPIIICDSNGVIVKAIETGRVGNFHSGARKILSGEVDDYAVTSCEAANNPLHKEGYNCPIEIDGRRAGTFGITGKLELAKPLARMAALILSFWIREQKQEAMVEETAHDVFAYINELLRKTREADQKFNTVMAEMQQASDEASDKVNATDEIFHQLHRLSQQSHILSINGSVEAVRAGESGRAFSVIAGEMARLAQNTRGMAEDIHRTLGEIRCAITHVNTAIEKSAVISKEHNQMVQEVTHLIRSLKTSVNSLEATFSSGN